VKISANWSADAMGRISMTPGLRFAEPIVFDGDTLGTRHQFRWIGSSKGETCLVVLEDGRFDERMKIVLEMEKGGYLIENNMKREVDAKSLGKGDILSLHCG
jgi:hypothetical protein